MLFLYSFSKNKHEYITHRHLKGLIKKERSSMVLISYHFRYEMYSYSLPDTIWIIKISNGLEISHQKIDLSSEHNKLSSKYITSFQRRENVLALQWRCLNVETTWCAGWVPPPSLRTDQESEISKHIVSRNEHLSHLFIAITVIFLNTHFCSL